MSDEVVLRTVGSLRFEQIAHTPKGRKARAHTPYLLSTSY